jgi:diketogulonate reductase-like aldo/keto reductase
MTDMTTTTPASRASPKIIYGTAWKRERTPELVSLAIRHGFRAIDTACQPKHYDEPGVGRGLAECLGADLTRADLYIQSKFTAVTGHDPERVPYDSRAPLREQVAQSFAASLENLQTTYLDCLLLHSPMRSAEALIEVWTAMERICDAGGVRRLGISNCHRRPYLEVLYRLARIKPAVVQNRFCKETGYDADLRAFCAAHDIAYQGFATRTANGDLLGRGEIAELASRYRRAPAQILLRYLTQLGVVPLTGTTSGAHMDENLGIFSFELGEEECRSLDGLLHGAPQTAAVTAALSP